MQVQIIGGVLLLVGAFLALVDVRSLVERWLGNSIQKGTIDVKAGSQVRTVKGKLTDMANEGLVYSYKMDGEWTTVTLPENYPEEFKRGRRMIRVKVGEAQASPLGGENEFKESADVMSAVVFSALFTRMMKSVSQKKVMPKWIVWAIIGLGVAAYIVYTQFMVEPTLSPLEEFGGLWSWLLGAV